MSVVAPVAALFGAALPVVVGLGLGEHLSMPAVVGIAIAVAAVGLVSREGRTGATPRRTAVPAIPWCWPWWRAARSAGSSCS